MAKKRTWLEKKVSTPKNYGKKTTPKKVNVPKNNGKKPNSKNLKKDSKNDGKKTSKSDNKPKIAPQRIPKNEGKKKTTIEPQRIPKNYGKSEKKKTISIAPQRVPKREVEYQKKKQNERPTYFSSGAMRDGFSPVNYAKSIIGTGEDMLNDFFTGIGKIPESVIDNVANALAGAYSKSGQEDKYKQITDFVQRDLNKEFGFGDRISQFFVPLQTVSKTYDIANKILNGGNYENVSLLGEKSDSIVQSAGTLAGQIGLQESGINWMLTTASTSYNSALEEAYQNGATWEDSQRYAAISSVAEVLSERISGGIKLGGRTLDEGVKKVLTGKIKNNVARTFAKYGFDAVGEGAEEVVSQLGQNLGKKLSFEKDKDWEEIFLSEEARQEYIDSFIGGFVLPMVTNAGRLKTSATTGRDYDSNLSNNEINIVNGETQKRVNEAKKKKAVSDEITRRIDEANNLLGNVSEKRRSEIEKAVNKEYDEGRDYTETELSKKELNSIEDEVLKDLNLGKIDIDTIEEYFEPEKVRRINEINRTIDNAENKEALLEERNKLRSEIAENMKERLREDYVLQESYRQKNLANEKFSTKVSKNESDITKKLRESMEASGADNTRDTHNLYSILNKYGNDTGTEVVVVNSEQMREIGFSGQNSEGKNLVVQGMHKVIDGKHKLIINKDSDQALKIIAGHEITHGLEEANAYKDLQEAVFAYAKKKGDYDTVRKEFESLYDGVTDDIDGEVTSELVGRYLFEDDAFINQLSTEKPGLIKQILEKVKRLLNMVTAGSKEARQLEQVKIKFEKAYREVSKTTNSKADNNTKYHVSNVFSDEIDKVLSGKIKSSNQIKARDYTPEILVKNGVIDRPMLITQRHVKSVVYSEDDAKKLGLPMNKGIHYHGLGKELLIKSIDSMDDPSEIYMKDNEHYLVITEIKDDNGDNVVIPIKIDGKGAYNDVYIDENQILSAYGKKNLTGYLKKNNFERIYTKKGIALNEEVQYLNISNPFSTNISENEKNVNESNESKTKFSLTEDSNGKALSEGQREYFKDSKVVDSNGRLKVMYHGTARADRVGYIFDPERATSGPMAFFTDSEEIANNYARDKKDTSIAYDERYDSYFTQFRTMINGKDSPIGDLWRTYSKAEKEEFIEKAKHITFDEDWENIVYNPDEEHGLGNYDDYTLKNVQGNGITALIQSWLEDGNLYNNESKFLDVLKLAGIENVTYLDPEYRDEKTYSVYLNVTNPVKTSEIDEEFADALEQWLDSVDLDGYGKETSYSDMWDKNNRDPYEWLEDLRKDIKNNTTRVWTSIPDAITGFLKEQGYDGIVDEGGKNSGYTHQVVIPFSSEQIKDTTNLNPTDNVDIRYSLRESKKTLNHITVRDYAAELQSEYDTTFNPYNDIKELYGFMDSVDGKLSAEDLQEAESMASSIADDILLNMKASQTLTEEASDILKDLRGAKIALSDNQKSEVATAYDGYGRYVQSLFGSVRISKNGVPLDEQWQYWADAYPNLFDRGTPDSEQPMRLAEIIEQLRNSFEVTDLPNKTDIELKILSDFYDYPGMRYDKSEATFADAESSVQRKFKGEEVIDEPLRTGDVIDEEIALTESMLQDNIEKGNLILSKALERKLRDLRRERKRSIPSRKEIYKAYVDEIKNEFKANGMDFNKVLEDAKDKSTFSSVDNTPQRFIEKTLGYKEGQIFNKMTMSKLGKNEADGIRWLNSITGSNGLLSTLYDKYKIKPASKESAAAQKYAEGRYVNDYGDYVKYGDEELAREFKDTKTQEKIRGLATDPLIREFYDNTFDRINESRVRNGYEPVPKRKNYYLHFLEDRSPYSRMGFPFNPNQIKEKYLPTDINGMTADNKPGQPYFASAQQRKGIRTTYDILGGIEKYANAAKDQIYHIDDIQRFRAVRNYLADMFGQEHGFDDLDILEPKKQKERIKKILDKHLTNFAKFLNEEANIIAGKTSLIDRGLEGIIGRGGLGFIKTLNSQVGSNMVGMNVGSSLTNMVSVVQAVSKSSKADAIKSFTQMCLNTIVKTDDLMEQSDFWTRRQGSERFYKNPWQKAQDLGYTLMTITDNFATEFIIRTKYNEFKRKGYDNPLQKADEWAARLLSDRSLGQMPQLYNSKALGLITKFQLEVRNQLDSMWYDTVNEAKETSNNTLVRTAKITSTVVQLAIFQHLFGKAFESVAGYNPAFDIVSVLMTAFGVGDDDDDKEPMDRIEEAFLELLEDLPYTSTLKGGRIPMASALPVNEFITGQNKYGQDKSRLETIKEAAPYWLMPTGYGQIKKTVKGMKMFDKDNPVPGQYNKSGKLQYPVDDNVMSRIQASIFGANANKNAREYYDGKHKPLTEKQLKEYQELNIPISEYWKYRKGLSEAGDKNDDKIKYINELNFPLEKKSVMMNNLYNKKEDAEKWYATKPAIYSVLGDDYAKAVRKLNTFKADKDDDGKTISGSKKEKVIDYLNKSEFDYAEKLIIFESEGYKLTDDEHLEVIDYLNNREDVSYEQMEDILKALGYEVDEEGNVRW